MCEQCADALKHLDKRFDELTRLQREFLQHQISSLPKYLGNARLYLASATTLNFAWHMQSQVLMRVTSIIVGVGSAATLQIADRTFSFSGQTVLNLNPDGMLIRPEDQIILTQQTAGPISLEFLGQEMADRGQRW